LIISCLYARSQAVSPACRRRDYLGPETADRTLINSLE
jgi:hypothetical protein